MLDFDLAAAVDDHRAFAVQLVDDHTRFGEEADVSQIDVEVISNLPVVSGLRHQKNSVNDDRPSPSTH